MSAESPRHARATSGGGPLTVPAQPPSDRSLIDAVSGFINDVTLSSSNNTDSKDVIQWARFETADINEPTPEGDNDDISPLLLILGYGAGVQAWLVPPSGEAQEVLSWRQGTVRVLRILPTPQHGDVFASKRPLIALCDSASPGPSFCSLSFISIRGGEQVKSIKFKNPILDVLANKRSVVVSFSERFAVFDAATLEDRMAITTCYPCPCPLGGSNPVNPLALGDRWLAYADKKLNPSKRSSGGCEGEGQTSYTATVLHAAKSLSKGLRGLGESVAHSLAGGRSTSQSPSPPNADTPHPGVVTILDVEWYQKITSLLSVCADPKAWLIGQSLRGLRECVTHSLVGGHSTSQAPSPPTDDTPHPGLITILDIEGNDEEDGQDSEEAYDPIVAHFIAHSEPIIALKFDASGTLLVTADRRGHDFHVFRINPHPCGPSLASVHHLYILHRGDTTAKVQDIAISPDSRWTAISTLRGTTHIFAISPYGGACGVRTHTSPRVVNRLSRFHRSAGLPIHPHTITSGSPVSDGSGAGAWFPNPRLPPYPTPAVNTPLAQLRATANLPTHTITRTSSGRQRLSSLSEDSNTVPLLARARFGIAPVPQTTVSGNSSKAPATAALYLMSATGCLSHIALHPRPARNVPKEKICDETPIELEVEPIAQWPLQRPAAAGDLLAPLPPSNPLLQPLSCRRCADMCMSEEERWLAQVEIVTHAGPHRRLWMGPQFVFKTYNCTGSNSSLSEAETVEVDTVAARGVARSNPVNMPTARPVVPVLIDSGSASECSLEHSPSDSFRRKSLLAESGRAASVCDVQLKEDLAEAMKEDQGWRSEATRETPEPRRGVARVVDPQGTVVSPPEAQSPPPLEPDDYTRSNQDEGTFRPVVRAPAALPLDPDIVVRPLPRSTTIPVQNVSPLTGLSPADEPLPLNTDVVIPAALTSVSDWHASNTVQDKVPAKPTIVPVQDNTGESFNSVKLDTPPARKKERTPEVTKSEEAVKEKTTPAKKERTPDVAKLEELVKEKPTRADSEKVEKASAQKETKDKKKDIAGKVEKSVKQKDSSDSTKIEQKNATKVEKISSQKDTKLDKSIEKKDASTEDIKSSKTKDSATIDKIEAKETAAKVDKPAKQKTEDPKYDAAKQDARATDVAPVDSVNVDIKQTVVNKDLKREESDVRKHESERSSADRAERERDHSKLLPKSNRSPDDIHPAASVRSKKSPTPKSVSDRDSEVSYKNKSKRSIEPKEVDKVKETKVVKEPKEIEKEKNARDSTCNKEFKVSIDSVVEKTSDEIKNVDLLTVINIDKREDIVKVDKKEEIVIFEDEPSVAITLKTSAQKETMKKQEEQEIKTEDQAWDMLLNEPDKPITFNLNQQEDKPKSKKNKKLKKAQEEQNSSKEDDSFVEIHAIEDKHEPSSGELVSISTPFDEIELNTSYKSKRRVSKTLTPEKKEQSKSIEFIPQEEPELICLKTKPKKHEDKSDIEVIHTVQALKEVVKDTPSVKVKKHSDGTSSETSSCWKELPKPNKSKSLSPYPELRKSEKHVELEKDVYVINTADEEFPEIQITRGNKARKRSPQPVERKPIDPVIEKPAKSWSSIAAEKEPLADKTTKSWSTIAADKEGVVKPTKSWKPFAETERAAKSWNPIASEKEVEKSEKSWSFVAAEKEPLVEKPPKSWSSIAAAKSTKKVDDEIKEDIRVESEKFEENPMSSKVSLQDKLIELCKRTDIMVAECDAPPELNFVEEHHAVIPDLPPLEPLDFGLDDFKLEVMRDSLLEVNDPKITSPICKINIDDILSSIKETTAKAIESSAFNLIDLEKLPMKKEKGFSVIEGHKITSQEVRLDDDMKEEKEGEIMEKSSEDDTSPVVSTDSDKEDKKNAGASNLTLPSSKQSAKSKKSRRKKK